MARSKVDDWTPGEIVPERPKRRVPMSIRVPREIYDELGLYARRVGTNRSYLIMECLRRLLAAKKVQGPEPKQERPRGSRAKR